MGRQKNVLQMKKQEKTFNEMKSNLLNNELKEKQL